MKRISHSLVNWSWCLPQSLLGVVWALLVQFVIDPKSRRLGRWRNTHVTLYRRIHGGVSLGPWLFCHEDMVEKGVLHHEYGHYRQSLILGPLYLPLVGLPSIGWAIVKKMGFFETVSYYDFPTERWADRLARIRRGPLPGPGLTSCSPGLLLSGKGQVPPLPELVLTHCEVGNE